MPGEDPEDLDPEEQEKAEWPEWAAGQEWSWPWAAGAGSPGSRVRRR